jgi:arylsulfatase A-like enzyme
MITSRRLVLGITSVSGLALLVVLVWACTRSARSSDQDAPTRKINHVILLTIDTLRADALPFLGNRRTKTPNLDALARQSVLFEQTVATSPWTRPSMVSILTGLPPSIHGATMRDVEVEAVLPETVRTLAERMRDAGYHTAGLGYNPFLACSTNVKRGFQEFGVYPAKITRSDGSRRSLHNNTGTIGCMNAVDGSSSDVGEIIDVFNSTTILTELAKKWLVEHAAHDFFLWVHYYDPHAPFMPPQSEFNQLTGKRELSLEDFDKLENFHGRLVESFLHYERLMLDGKDTAEDRGKHQRLKKMLEERFELIHDLYLAEVEYVDRAIGQVLDTLKWANLYDDALIVITADHGEEFGEHGGVEHGHTQYQELLHVPLFIKLPGGKEIRRIPDRVSILSVYPTILDLCLGERPLADAPAPSLTGAWTPGVDLRHPPYFVADSVMYGEPRVALFFDRMKYIWNKKSGKEELYDLTADPAEKTSLVASDPTSLKQARAHLEDYTKKSAAQKKQIWSAGMRMTAKDPGTRKLLRQHGYLK